MPWDVDSDIVRKKFNCFVQGSVVLEKDRLNTFSLEMENQIREDVKFGLWQILG